MNKVFQINLGGIVFTIEENAYETLKTYLDKLHKHFGNTNDASDIVGDIEARIAELFNQKIKDERSTLFANDINEVLGIMGDVNQMDSSENTNEPKQEHKQYATQNLRTARLRRNPYDESLGGVCSGIGSYFDIDPTLVRILFVVSIVLYGSGLIFYFVMWLVIPKASGEDAEIMRTQRQIRTRKLFRDMDSRTISGVCSGLAAFFALDTIWIRLALVASFFFFGSGLILYIILWIIIPKAQTAGEKLQMRGEPVDIRNIERQVKTDGFSSSNSSNNFAQKSGSVLRGIFTVLLKIFLGIIAFSAFATALAIAIGLVCVMLGIGHGTGMIKHFIMLASDDNIVLITAKLGIVCMLIVPIVGFILFAIRILFKPKYKTRVVFLSLLALFFIGICLIIYSGLRYKDGIRSSFTKNQYIGLPKTDTLYLSMAEATENTDGEVLPKIQINDEHLVFNDNGLLLPFDELKIKKSIHDSIGMTIKFEAKGKDQTDAEKNADEINFVPKINNNKIILPHGIWIEKDKKYKFQSINIKLSMPVGTVLIVDEAVFEMLDDKYDLCDNDADNAILKMTEKGLQVITCNEEKDIINTEDSYENDSIHNDIDINISGDDDNNDNGKVSIKIGTNDNKKIKVTGKTITKNGKKMRVEETQIGPIKVTKEIER